jgi:hypothetical protein
MTDDLSIGTGTPTSTGQALTLLPNTATSGTGTPDPYGFVLFDRNVSVAGNDVLYLADNRSVASGGGIQKWTFNGSIWSLSATFSGVSSGSAVGYHGVAGTILNGNVVLMGTTNEATGNRVVVFIDTGSGMPCSWHALAGAGQVSDLELRLTHPVKTRSRANAEYCANRIHAG